MSLWERLVRWFGREEPFEPPEMNLPEYDRPRQDWRPQVRRTRQEDDERAEESLKFLQDYVRGVQADLGRQQGRPRRPGR